MRCGGFATANRAAQRTNTSGVDADPGTLGNIFHNRAGGGVDGVFVKDIVTNTLDAMIVRSITDLAKAPKSAIATASPCCVITIPIVFLCLCVA